MTPLDTDITSRYSISVADKLKEDLPLIYVSPGFEQLTGYPIKDIVGKNCRFLQGDRSDQRGVHVMKDEIAESLNEYLSTPPGPHGRCAYTVDYAICREIMNQHGGHAGVTKTDDNGVTFSLTFPANRVKSK